LLAQPGISKLLAADGAARGVDDPELATAARLVRLAVAARGLADEGTIGEGRLLAELALVAGLLSRERGHIVAQGLQEAALVLDTSRSRDAAVRNLAQSFASVEGGANRQERPSEATVKPLKDPYSKWDKNTFTALLGNVETINTHHHALSCRGWQLRTLRLLRQHRVRRLRARQRAPPPAREARGSGRRLHVSRSRGGVGHRHRSRATVFCVCEERWRENQNRRTEICQL